MNSFCKFFLAVSLFYCGNNYAQEWYEGGTLHQATAKQWHQATSHNQLATSADFIVSLKAADTINQLKVRSYALQKCISSATQDSSLYNLKVSDVGVLCILQLGYK